MNDIVPVLRRDGTSVPARPLYTPEGEPVLDQNTGKQMLAPVDYDPWTAAQKGY